MENKKVFYETVETETVNDEEVYENSYDLHYGVIPGSGDGFKPSFGTYNGCSSREGVYESILKYIKENPSHYFHIMEKRGKEELYIDNYPEDKWQKVKVDEIFKYSHKCEYKEVYPTLFKIVRQLPADELVEWIKDNDLSLGDVIGCAIKGV